MPRAALLVALLAAGCGGARFDGSVYRHGELAFRVPSPPAAWRRIEVSDALLAFRDDANDATIAVNGRCGADAEDTPLAALTQHLFLMFTEREVVSQVVVPLDGREAMRSVLVAKLDGVAKKFDVWVLKKDGCVYDFLYISRPETFERGAPSFERFVQGFSTVTEGDAA